MTRKLLFAAMILFCMAFASAGWAEDLIDIKELEAKAAQEDGDASFQLGELYANGDGVEKDLSTALKWYGKACDDGNMKGCSAAARLLSRGVK